MSVWLKRPLLTERIYCMFYKSYYLTLIVKVVNQIEEMGSEENYFTLQFLAFCNKEPKNKYIR